MRIRLGGHKGELLGHLGLRVCSKRPLSFQQRSPLLEVKGNIELKRPLAKAASRLPLSGRRLKRGPDQMEEALEPEKVSWVWRSMDVCMKPSGTELWSPPHPCLSPEKNTRPGHQSDHDPPQSGSPQLCATDTRPDRRWAPGLERDPVHSSAHFCLCLFV